MTALPRMVWSATTRDFVAETRLEPKLLPIGVHVQYGCTSLRRQNFRLPGSVNTSLEMTDEDYNVGELLIWNFFICVVDIHR